MRVLLTPWATSKYGGFLSMARSQQTYSFQGLVHTLTYRLAASLPQPAPSSLFQIVDAGLASRHARPAGPSLGLAISHWRMHHTLELR